MLMRSQPSRLLLLGVVFQLWLGLSQVPVLGLLVVLSVPLITAGLLQAFDTIARGRTPPLATVFAGLGSPVLMTRLLLLGGLMLAGGMLAVVMVFSGVIAEIDPQLLLRLEQGDVEALQMVDPAVLQRLLLALAVGMAITGTFSYFAVPLIWFGRRPLGVALIEGLQALVRFWLPLLVMAFGLGVMAIPVGLLAGMLYALASQSGALGSVYMALLLLLALAFQLLLFATQYVAFREIFGLPEQDGDQDGEADDQLVA